MSNVLLLLLFTCAGIYACSTYDASSTQSSQSIITPDPKFTNGTTCSASYFNTLQPLQFQPNVSVTYNYLTAHIMFNEDLLLRGTSFYFKPLDMPFPYDSVEISSEILTYVGLGYITPITFVSKANVTIQRQNFASLLCQTI